VIRSSHPRRESISKRSAVAKRGSSRDHQSRARSEKIAEQRSAVSSRPVHKSHLLAQYLARRESAAPFLPLIRKLCAPFLSLSLSLSLPASSNPSGPLAREVVFDSALIQFLAATAAVARNRGAGAQREKEREREKRLAKELDYPTVLFRQDGSSRFSVSVGTKL